MLRQTQTRCLPARTLLVLEELIERHRVVNFRRMQFEQFGDLTHGLNRDVSLRVLHQMQGGQHDRSLVRILRKLRPNLVPQFLAQHSHLCLTQFSRGQPRKTRKGTEKEAEAI